MINIQILFDCCHFGLNSVVQISRRNFEIGGGWGRAMLRNLLCLRFKIYHHNGFKTNIIYRKVYVVKIVK